MSISEKLAGFLAGEEKKELVRISTAGSVDDGKSTLIGRLLHDSKSLYEDHLQAVRTGTGSDDFDWAGLVDGLKAEREQGITIDVAYRYFSTPKRKFILADTPGHEQYTRNMVTGASTADLAVILIDARLGIRPQSKRHAFITSLLRIPHVLVAVNKMDLVDYSETVFDDIVATFSAFCNKLDIGDLRFIPISALKGDNVVTKSDKMPWFTGRALLDDLDSIYIGGDNYVDLRFPVQYVSRPNATFRGYAGNLSSGILRKGGEVMVLPSGKSTRIKSIETYDGALEQATPNMAVTITLHDELDISRGDMIVAPHNRTKISRDIEAMMVWMGESALDPQRRYLLKHTAQTTNVQVSDLLYKVNINNLRRMSADTLQLNEIGRVALTCYQPIKFDTYRKNRTTGSFILIDAESNHTVAAGMIIDREPAASRSTKTTALGASASPAAWLGLTDREPFSFWICAPRLAPEAEQMVVRLREALAAADRPLFLLDETALRTGLCAELGTGALAQAELLRRAAETVKLFQNTGVTVLCHVDCPLPALIDFVVPVLGADHIAAVSLHEEPQPAGDFFIWPQGDDTAQGVVSAAIIDRILQRTQPAKNP